ncbi:uncharacterized protein LOC111030240 [Myzus persicae]|uniref:uncharacterized protein LOC111030240 n=1 Tax=Myzus persicae TaxID=13164 RepID=UPI000B930DCC|nr:uncharacterized protein LOC111030240 [Myzus persicae]
MIMQNPILIQVLTKKIKILKTKIEITAKQFQNIQTEKITSRGHHTVSDWYNLCQDVVVEQFKHRGKMVGKGYIVQIDGSLFQGKRKYNRGRIRLGDHRPNDNAKSYSDSSSDEENQNIENQNRNNGNRVQGPWVFGMCCLRQDNILERRYFIVDKRGRETLLPIIVEEIESETTI